MALANLDNILVNEHLLDFGFNESKWLNEIINIYKTNCQYSLQQKDDSIFFSPYNIDIDQSTQEKIIAKFERLGIVKMISHNERYYRCKIDFKALDSNVSSLFFRDIQQQRPNDAPYYVPSKKGIAIAAKLKSFKEVPAPRFITRSKRDHTKTPKKSDFTIKKSNELLVVDIDDQKTAHELFEYWNSLGSPIPKHKTHRSLSYTKAYEKAVIHISNLLNQKRRKKTENDIVHSMTTYKEIIERALQEPALSYIRPGNVGHLVGIGDFFKMSEYTKHRINYMSRHTQFTIDKSWFYECLPDKDPFVKFFKKFCDDNSDLTAYIIDLYREYFDNKREFNDYDRKSFVRSAKMINKFYDDNKDRFTNSIVEQNVFSIAKILVELISDTSRDRNVSPGWLSTSWLFADKLPSHLRSKELMDTSNQSMDRCILQNEYSDTHLAEIVQNSRNFEAEQIRQEIKRNKRKMQGAFEKLPQAKQKDLIRSWRKEIKQKLASIALD